MYQPQQIVISRYDVTTGALIETVSTKPLRLKTKCRIMGGCDSGEIEFNTAWGDEFVCAIGDDVRVSYGGVPVYSGRVTEVAPNFDDGKQRVLLDGWWKYINEIPILDDVKDDRLAFGDTDDAVAPLNAITTAYGVISWLFSNKIDVSGSPIRDSTFTASSATTKLGAGGFAIYANDKLGQVLETLATMDDCAIGITANRELYLVPRDTILATTGFELRAAETPPTAWNENQIGLVLGGKFLQERRGPNQIQISSRDINRVPGARTYIYAGTLTGSQRVGYYHAPQVRTGQAARRLAKGLFRRFANFGLKVEGLTAIFGTRRFEPYLGKTKVYDGGVEIASGIAGEIDIDWLGALEASITLGENAVDPGGGNPINDPFATTALSWDVAQIDTGDGTWTEDPDYTIPSYEIDEDDGYSGDGDDLHTNPARDDWTDPPGDGIDGIDYGPDTVDPDNGSSTATGVAPTGTSGGMRQLARARVTAKPTDTTYNVLVLDKDGADTSETFSSVTCSPESTDRFSIADIVELHWVDDTEGASPYIFNNVADSGVQSIPPHGHTGDDDGGIVGPFLGA